MADSEDEFFSRKKQCRFLDDSENEGNNEKHSDSKHSIRHSSSPQTSDFNLKSLTDVNQLDTSLLNGEKSDRLYSVPISTSDDSNAIIQRNDKDQCHSQSSQSDQSSQSNIRSENSVSSVKRKSCSNSDSSDSDSSRSTLDNNRNSRRIERLSSPGFESNSQNSYMNLVSNRNLKNTKSSIVSSDSDGESKLIDTSIYSAVSSMLAPKEKSDNLSDSEIIEMPKLKKYKLLSEDDFSEDDGQPSLGQQLDSQLDSGNQNSNPLQGVKLKKEKRKKKLQILNELKRKEMKEKFGNVLSDSDCENTEVFNTSEDIHNNSTKTSSDNSVASESDSGNAKEETKQVRKSLPQRKSKKIDPKLEIKSKTQKMIRENKISLPYHQPKKRSLDEFLARRKNTMSIPLKTTNDVLHVVSEHLLKREEEVKIFYKSESDHSDNDTKHVRTLNEIVSNPISELQNQENLQENLVMCSNNISNLLNGNIRINDVDIQEITKSVKIVPVAVNSCEQNLSGNISELPNGNRDSSMMDFGVPNAEENKEFSNQLPNIETSVAVHEEIGDLIGTEKINVSEDRPIPLPSETDLPVTADAVEKNSEVNSVSNLPIVEESTKQNSVDSTEVIIKNQEQSLPKKCLFEDNSSEIVYKEAEMKSVLKEPDTEQQGTEDFDLMIRDSEENKTDSETVTPEPTVDLRNKKLALLSRLNIPLHTDIKLRASPDTVIELNTTSISESEFGVYELKKKFAFHSSMHNTTVRKTSTKLSILRTETDSQGEIINVVKETIDFGGKEVKKDEDNKSFSTPGVKHMNFKEHMLQSLIEKKREKWNEYQKEKRKLYGAQSSDDEEFDEESNDKPDFEPYHPEDELDDEELEEDDVEIKEKKMKRNDFVDDEAEISYDEDENLKESDVEDEESENEVEAEEVAVEEDNEVVDDEADMKADDKDEDEDSDAEMLNTKIDKKTDLNQPPTTETFKKPLLSQMGPLFKYNTTGTDLENKVLGFESVFAKGSQISQEATNSQLFEICSGKFVTQAEKLNSSDPSDSEFFVDSQHGEDSQNINLSLQDTCDGFNVSNTRVEDNDKSLLFLSDESDTEELFARKKKLMRLEDSDDETDDPVPIDSAKSEEEVTEEANDKKDADEHNDDEDADEVNSFGDEEEEFAYNSEEEIITKQKAAEFFDNEAELSDSEWGSEDENEQNLDELEKEAGDDDVLDEDELKKELGKIHMRQLLDDDQKDVRMLKEMLLEDGELHSDGQRQRKFQWTNLDDNGFFSKMANDSDEEVLNEEDEEETDANWRKIRHEREMFISQQEKREDLLEEADDETNDSLPLPKVNTNNVSANSNKPTVTNNNITSPNLKLPFKARFKCGSFLTRSKVLLDRIAITVGECKENVTGKVKNHRNFVFAAVSPEKELPNVPETKTEKRKISSKLVMASKKLKLASSTNQRGLLAQLALSE